MPLSDFQQARTLLIHGDPVPVDVIARLVESGYNYAAMENTYSRFPFFNPNDEERSYGGKV